MARRPLTDAQKAAKRAHYHATKRPLTDEEKAQMRAYYRANKHRWQSPERRDKSAAYRLAHKTERLAAGQKRRRALRAAIYAIKRKPCADCGDSFPPYVMDLDHRRGTKVRDVSSLIDNGVSIERVMAEVAKCDVVCSNCHRIRTHRDRGTIC